MIVFGVNFENVYKELSGYSAIIILTNGPRSCKFLEEKFEKNSNTLCGWELHTSDVVGYPKHGGKPDFFDT